MSQTSDPTPDQVRAVLSYLGRRPKKFTPAQLTAASLRLEAGRAKLAARRAKTSPHP